MILESYLTIKVLATKTLTLQSSGYCVAINRNFTFHTTNIFGCFHNVMAQFQLVRHKFLNSMTLHVHLCSFQKYTSSEAIYNVSTYQLPQYYQPHWVPSTAWTDYMIWMPLTIMYQNIAKVLTHISVCECIYIYIYIYIIKTHVAKSIYM